MASEGASRTARTVSFLALPDAEEYPKWPLTIILSLISFSEGADAAVFPAVTKALERLEGFDVTNLGFLSFVQLIFQAVAGPCWGILASRGILERKTILIIGTFVQGLATIVMWMNLSLPYLMFLRAINGIMLASLRPIANSIMGDRFDDAERGQFFGYIMMSLQLGNAIFTLIGTAVSEEYIDLFGGFYGWILSFIGVGAFTMSLAPLVYVFLKAPPVKIAANAGKLGIAGEFQMLKRLMQKFTFASLVFQGCFGLIPWRAFDYRTFFFQNQGLSNTDAGFAQSMGGFSAAAGSVGGGKIADLLAKVFSKTHGRILSAEISVYGGIPVAFLTFMVKPDTENLLPYYLSLVIALGLIATWTSAGTNSPILCALANEDERSLVLAWQTSLEGAVGALGPLMFVFLLSNVFNYDKACFNADVSSRPAICEENKNAAGRALFWTSCVPWAVCGLIYSTLHWTYPADLEATIQERGNKESELGVRSQEV